MPQTRAIVIGRFPLKIARATLNLAFLTAVRDGFWLFHHRIIAVSMEGLKTMPWPRLPSRSSCWIPAFVDD
jgi:hypothetical protein